MAANPPTTNVDTTATSATARPAVLAARRRGPRSKMVRSAGSGADSISDASRSSPILIRASRGIGRLLSMLVQELGQPRPSVDQMYPSRRSRAAEDPGDLGRGPILEVEEDDRGALGGWELTDG